MKLSAEYVEGVQADLNLIGYSYVVIDGIPGDQTNDTIRDYNSKILSKNWREALKQEVLRLIPGSLPNPETSGKELCIEALTKEVKALCQKLDHNLPAQWAYVMATIQHETFGAYYPVEEAGYVSKKAQYNYLKKQRYYPHFGRGYVQITWKNNYRAFTNLLGKSSLGKELIRNFPLDLLRYPGQALNPQVSLLITVIGILQGRFRRNQFLARHVSVTQTNFIWARSCVNGTRPGKHYPDKAEAIAEHAEAWLTYYEQQEN